MKKIVINSLLVSLLLVLILVPDAKAFLLNGMMKVGLFSPGNEISREEPVIDDVRFQDGQGNTISLSALKGRVVFINFWATWCPPCRAEMPSINKLVKKFEGDEAIVFITVDADGNYARAKKFLDRRKYDLPLYTAAGSVPRALFSGSLPTTVVIDKSGKLAFRHEGLADYSSKKFQDMLVSLSK